MSSIYPVFIINLAKHSERFEFIQEQFHSLGVQVHRIEAFNGYDKDLMRHANASWYAPLSPGEIGCFESHRLFWKKIIDGNHEGAFVFEDDMLIASDFCEIEFPSRLLENVDVIKLDESLPRFSLYGEKKVSAGKTRNLVRMLGSEMSTGGYFVTKKGAQKLLDMSKHYVHPVDVFMFDRLSPFFWKLNIWKVDNAIATQVHMFVEESKLSNQYKDRIQNDDVNKPITIKQAIKKAAFMLYRVINRDIRIQRYARAELKTQLFAKNENISFKHISFSSASNQHFEKGLSKVITNL
jgi:glycosyl transferase family 25